MVSSLAGPWFVGELIDGHMGACFSFGVFVGGSFLQGSMTFAVGILQVSIYKIKAEKLVFFLWDFFPIFLNSFIKKGVLVVDQWPCLTTRGLSYLSADLKGRKEGGCALFSLTSLFL